jgi:hypothetical protein
VLAATSCRPSTTSSSRQSRPGRTSRSTDRCYRRTERCEDPGSGLACCQASCPTTPPLRPKVRAAGEQAADAGGKVDPEGGNPRFLPLMMWRRRNRTHTRFQWGAVGQGARALDESKEAARRPRSGGGGNRTRVRGRTGESVYKRSLRFAFARRPVRRRPTDGLAILWMSRRRRLALLWRRARLLTPLPEPRAELGATLYLTRLGGECEFVIRTY